MYDLQEGCIALALHGNVVIDPIIAQVEPPLQYHRVMRTFPKWLHMRIKTLLPRAGHHIAIHGLRTLHPHRKTHVKPFR